MDNYIVTLAILALMIHSGSSNVRLIIALSCVAMEAVSVFDLDIALHYSVGALVSMWFAIASPNCTAGRFLSVIFSLQCAMCLIAIPDYGFDANNIVKFNLFKFNDILAFSLICVGVCSGDNYTRRERGRC